MTVVPEGTIRVEVEGVEAGEVFTVTLVGMSFQAALGTLL